MPDPSRARYIAELETLRAAAVREMVAALPCFVVTPEREREIAYLVERLIVDTLGVSTRLIQSFPTTS